MFTSPVFQQGKPIPPKYSCKGENISPALTWQGAPENTASFVLIMDDPDAPKGTWVHWVIYNLPDDVHHLSENANIASLGGIEGNNSWSKATYGGPCPPSGMHRYFFKLYALDGMLALPTGANKEQVLQAMKGHVLARAELMGTFMK